MMAQIPQVIKYCLICLINEVHVKGYFISILLLFFRYLLHHIVLLTLVLSNLEFIKITGYVT